MSWGRVVGPWAPLSLPAGARAPGSPCPACRDAAVPARAPRLTFAPPFAISPARVFAGPRSLPPEAIMHASHRQRHAIQRLQAVARHPGLQ
jgi:hypothetical protein